MRHEVRERTQLVVTQRIDRIGHRRNPAAGAVSGLEVAQRLEKIVLALPGGARGRFLAK